MAIKNMIDLRQEIEALKSENNYLKKLLDEAGIPYNHCEDTDRKATKEPYDSDQNERILPTDITFEHARVFFSYFWGRMDVFSKRYENKKTGKSGYFPQCSNFWRRGVCPKIENRSVKCKDCSYRAWTPLKPDQIMDHLKGAKEDCSDVIGIYPLFPDGTCRFLVFDFDNHSGDETDQKWMEEADTLRDICRLHSVPCLMERSRSGHGAHLWIFFTAAIDAHIVRKFAYALLDKGAESVNLKTFSYYDRILPSQDSLPDEYSLGNLIALPLQGKALKGGNSAFVNSSWNAYPDQWKALRATKRLSEKALRTLMDEWDNSADFSFTFTEISANGVREKPWERTDSFHSDDLMSTMKITLSDRIYIDTHGMKPRLQNQIRRMARINNPSYFRNQAMGLSNYDNSRYVYLGEDDSGYIALPRGLLDELRQRCEEANIAAEIDDQRTPGKLLQVKFTGSLRENQQEAVTNLLKFDCGILSAATAFGKTVACMNIIAERKVSTLILLESSALIEQWENAVSRFLVIDEPLPEYVTPSGKTRRRKSHVGLIQGAKDTSTGIIDIAMAGSLKKKGIFHQRLLEYGLILVDECHHSASDTIRDILMHVKARYVYGVTATPIRKDGLEKVNYMLLGSVRHQYSSKQRAQDQGFQHFVIPRFTRAVSPHTRDGNHVNDDYEVIRNHALRNEQIIKDVRQCIENGRTPVVLSRYKDHADYLYQNVKDNANHVFLLTGDLSKKEQKELRQNLESVPDHESIILIATGQLIGEGFDFPRLDTLIMATPVAWKGIVEQYAGRLNRDYEGKQNVIIYDYVDCHIPVFDRMYLKRLKAYKRIGYQICSNEASEQTTETNSIFDIDSYLPVYEQDLCNASKSIVISSPMLNKPKVTRFIQLIQNCQEHGVKVTVVTWHPEMYKYGSDELRSELMELLRYSGIHLVLSDDTCSKYAVIDTNIVWYGSIHLLAKGDIEDNIMRIESAEIATELTEKTFHKGNGLKEYI